MLEGVHSRRVCSIRGQLTLLLTSLFFLSASHHLDPSRENLAHRRATCGLRGTLPCLRLRGGRVNEASGYKTRWSDEHKADEIILLGHGRQAYHGRGAERHNFIRLSTTDPPPVDPGWTVRAEDPIPSSGEHYFEVVLTQPHVATGGQLDRGWNTVGLVAGNVSDWNGAWWDDERRYSFWGVHDSQQSAFVSISSPNHFVNRWAEGGSFGCGDRVGILVDMDRGVAAVLLNGSFLGEAFHSLPRGTDGVQLFPAVTLAAENITAELSTPAAPALPPTRERIPAPLFGAPGSPGITPGSCSRPGHAALGCSGLCDVEALMDPAKYRALAGTPQEQDKLWESMYRDVLDETGFNAVVEGDERLFRLTYHKLSHSANGGDASLLEPHDAASLGAETLAGLLLDSKSGASAAVTVRGSWLDNDGLPGPADARAGCAFRAAVEQAPNRGTVHARAGVHRWQWQASLLEIADLAEQSPEGEPMRIFPPGELRHTWLWEDALIVPWRCAQHVRGESPHLTVLWGRWQLQKASIGSFARAALMAEVPIRGCETVEVLGAWAFRECEVRCAAGTALAVDNEGRAVLEVCGVGGDGDGRRQAHRAVRASASADVSLHDCILDRVGYHREAAGVVGTDSASVKVLRCQLRLLDVAVSLSWHARVALAQCVLERAYFAQFSVFPAREAAKLDAELRAEAAEKNPSQHGCTGGTNGQGARVAEASACGWQEEGGQLPWGGEDETSQGACDGADVLGTGPEADRRRAADAAAVRFEAARKRAEWPGWRKKLRCGGAGAPRGVMEELYSDDEPAGEEAGVGEDSHEGLGDCTELALSDCTVHLNEAGEPALFITPFRPAEFGSHNTTLVPLMQDAPPLYAHRTVPWATWYVLGCTDALPTEDGKGGANEGDCGAVRSSKSRRLDVGEDRVALRQGAIKVGDSGAETRVVDAVSGKLRCLHGSECIFQRFDRSHRARFDHSPLSQGASARAPQPPPSPPCALHTEADQRAVEDAEWDSAEAAVRLNPTLLLTTYWNLNNTTFGRPGRAGILKHAGGQVPEASLCLTPLLTLADRADG